MFSPVIAIGGAGIDKQIKAIALDARVVVGTPGRIIDLMKRGQITLRSARFFVLDEADEMLSMGFFDEVERILREIPNGSQGIFTSATLSDRVTMLAGKYLNRYEKVIVSDFDEGENSRGKIEHFYFKVADMLLAKIDATEKVIAKFTPRSSIIFCNTKSDTDFVEVVLRKRGVNLVKINSDLPQSKRDSVLRQFRDEAIDVMVATDVAARGLDIDHVDLVIHYSLPETIESYTHRSGRTGRAGRDGISVSLVGPAELLTLFQMRKSGLVSLEELNLDA
jgi:ATP-dependent RNA helicase DeaD